MTVGLEESACLILVSASVMNEGSTASFSGTLTVVAESIFSWELEGSKASLLGTGVMFLLGLLFNWSVLDLVVVSRRHGEEGIWEVGVEVAIVAASLSFEAALEKKPRMLFCCFPVVEAELGFLDNEGVVVAPVGVPAALPGVRVRVAPVFSPILLRLLHLEERKETVSINPDLYIPRFPVSRSHRATELPDERKLESIDFSRETRREEEHFLS